MNFSYDEFKLSQQLTSLGDCLNGKNNHMGEKNESGNHRFTPFSLLKIHFAFSSTVFEKVW